MHNREMVPKWIKNLASSLFVSFVYHLHICKFLMSLPMSKMSPHCICYPPPPKGGGTILNPAPLHCADPCGKPCIYIYIYIYAIMETMCSHALGHMMYG